MKILNLNRDGLSQNAFAPELSDETWTIKIDADTDTTLIVPTGANVALIRSEGNFWVSDAVITIPVGNTFTKTGFEQNNAAITVTDITTLHFRAIASARISVSFFSAAR